MSHNPIRKDKTCLNCRHVVAQRYCPNCGQENTESRKTFYHLFVHFFEDLTHYENAFWRTIRNLILKPSALTKEYLSGKRLSYLAPVRLYIFISFITFFLLTVVPDTDYNLLGAKKTTTVKKGNTEEKNVESVKLSELLDNESLKDEIKDSIRQELRKEPAETKKNFKEVFQFGYKSVEELDSIQRYGNEDDRLDSFEYWVVKKGLEVQNNYTNEELIEKFKESFIHNLPKALFIYMPIFAFFLWLFHGKKRWYYFDHGIFTLHYFSFLLLMVLLIFLFSKVLSIFGTSSLADFAKSAFDFVAFLWMFYYFFPAHHRFYGETRFISGLKSIVLFFINMLLIITILAVFAIYTFINIH